MGAQKRVTPFFGLLFVAFAVCCVASCATFSEEEVRKEPYLRIIYVPGGDGPVVTLMDIDEEMIRLGEFGGRMFKKRISIDRSEPILREIARGVLDDLQTSPGIGRHDREIWIEVNGDSKVGFLADDPPQVLEDLLRAARELFAAEFGSRFDYVARHLP